MRPRAPGVAAAIEGTLIRRGDPGYEGARTGAVWNEATPPRCPDAIVRAATEADVVHAVAWARAQGLRVSMRSGGHNWSGSPLRDGGLLLDLSGLRQCGITPAHGTGPATATVGPGATGQDLVAALTPHDLAFPVGHCPTVAVGGFLLSGGLGWNSRAWGRPAPTYGRSGPSPPTGGRSPVATPSTPTSSGPPGAPGRASARPSPASASPCTPTPPRS